VNLDFFIAFIAPIEALRSKRNSSSDLSRFSGETSVRRPWIGRHSCERAPQVPPRLDTDSNSRGLEVQPGTPI